VVFSIAIGSIATGYINSAQRAQWSAINASANSLAQQRIEQIRSAKWDTQAYPFVVQALDLPVAPLIEELRASIDFYEHNEGRRVSKIFISGGAARSSVILQALQNKLPLPCKILDPTCCLTLELPPEKPAGIDREASLLFTATGAAPSWPKKSRATWNLPGTSCWLWSPRCPRAIPADGSSRPC